MFRGIDLIIHMANKIDYMRRKFRITYNILGSLYNEHQDLSGINHSNHAEKVIKSSVICLM